MMRSFALLLRFFGEAPCYWETMTFLERYRLGAREGNGPLRGGDLGATILLPNSRPAYRARDAEMGYGRSFWGVRRIFRSHLTRHLQGSTSQAS
jgi:hypothetical protein